MKRRTAARDRRQCRQARRGGPGSAERHLRAMFVRRLGRQECHPHHGFCVRSLHSFCAAGGGSRSPESFLRYDEKGLFLPEYVNVFGVPLSISETGEGGDPLRLRGRPPQIEVIPDRTPRDQVANVLRVETVVKPQLTMAWDKIPALVLDPASTPISAELAPALGGATDMGNVTAIESGAPSRRFRRTRLVFHSGCRKGFAELRQSFSEPRKTSPHNCAHCRELSEFQASRHTVALHADPLRRRILIALNIDLVVQHVMRHVSEQNTDASPLSLMKKIRSVPNRADADLVYDEASSPRSKSHISHLVGDPRGRGTPRMCSRGGITLSPM